MHDDPGARGAASTLAAAPPGGTEGAAQGSGEQAEEQPQGVAQDAGARGQAAASQVPKTFSGRRRPKTGVEKVIWDTISAAYQEQSEVKEQRSFWWKVAPKLRKVASTTPRLFESQGCSADLLSLALRCARGEE